MSAVKSEPKDMRHRKNMAHNLLENDKSSPELARIPYYNTRAVYVWGCVVLISSQNYRRPELENIRQNTTTMYIRCFLRVTTYHEQKQAIHPVAEDFGFESAELHLHSEKGEDRQVG